jgi:hypothetical protein
MRKNRSLVARQLAIHMPAADVLTPRKKLSHSALYGIRVEQPDFAYPLWRQFVLQNLAQRASLSRLPTGAQPGND